MVLAIDPSGNFKEGKGTSGLVLGTNEKNFVLKSLITIKAKHFITQEQYYQAIENHIKNPLVKVVVIEDFILYGSKAPALTGSRLETSKLIGRLEAFALRLNKKVVLQTASRAKSRWPNDLMARHNFIIIKGKRKYYQNILLNRHTLDAFKHFLFYVLIAKQD